MFQPVFSKSLVMLLSVLVALASWRFIVLGVEASMSFMIYHAQQRPLFFFAHVGFAPFALLLMPFQFLSGLRIRKLSMHRWIGRAYGIAVLISGIGGLFLAVNTNAGPVAALGFGIWVFGRCLARDDSPWNLARTCTPHFGTSYLDDPFGRLNLCCRNPAALHSHFSVGGLAI